MSQPPIMSDAAFDEWCQLRDLLKMDAEAGDDAVPVLKDKLETLRSACEYNDKLRRELNTERDTMASCHALLGSSVLDPNMSLVEKVQWVVDCKGTLEATLDQIKEQAEAERRGLCELHSRHMTEFRDRARAEVKAYANRNARLRDLLRLARTRLNQLVKEKGTKLTLLANKYREAIHNHRTNVRKDPCLEHDSELWAVLGDGDTEWAKPDRTPFEAMSGCLLYLMTHEGKHTRPAAPTGTAAATVASAARSAPPCEQAVYAFRGDQEPAGKKSFMKAVMEEAKPKVEEAVKKGLEKAGGLLRHGSIIDDPQPPKLNYWPEFFPYSTKEEMIEAFLENKCSPTFVCLRCGGLDLSFGCEYRPRDTIGGRKMGRIHSVKCKKCDWCTSSEDIKELLGELLEVYRRPADTIRATLLVNFGQGAKANKYDFWVADEGSTLDLLLIVLRHLTHFVDHWKAMYYRAALGPRAAEGTPD